MQYKSNLGGKASGYKNYQKVNITTASPAKLILMLYDGALRFLNHAKDSLQGEDLTAAHQAIIRAENIIIELINCLDFDKGGEIAKNLNSIYRFIYKKLIEANMNKDVSLIDACASMIGSLREGWMEMMAKIKEQGLSGDVIPDRGESSKSISIKG